MAVLKNRAKMSTSTTGTGSPITLGSAESGYQTFADAGVANADVVRYVIEDTGGAFEIGTGTYTATGTTLSRTVSESSNSDAAINLSGSATVFIGATAEDIPALYADNYDGTSTLPSATGTNALSLAPLSTSTGINSVSIGSSADATGNQAFSFGVNSSASGLRGISFGSSSFTNNTDAVAIGPSAQAQSVGGLALGHDATVITGAQAVAIGDSYASGADSFAAAIANNTSTYGATGANSIAIGAGLARATTSRAMAFGNNARAEGADSVAIGRSTDATASASFGFGYAVLASHANSVVLGTSASSSATNQITLGSTSDTVRISSAYTLPTSDGSANQVLTTNGSGAVTFADAGGGISNVVDDTTPQLGGNLDVQAREINTSTTNGNIVFNPNGTGVVEVKGAGGNDGTLQLNCSANSHGVKIKSPPHSAAASYTLTLPDDDGAASEFLQTDGSGNLSWAAGGGGDPDLYRDNASSATTPSATGTNAVSIGSNSTATGNAAVAIGQGDGDATGDYAFAVAGQATNTSAISIGTSSAANGFKSVSLGADSRASGTRGVAIGANAQAISGANATAIADSYASGTDSLAAAIGNNTSTYGALSGNTIAIGLNAKANPSQTNAIAIGGYATSSSTGSIALGYSSSVTSTGLYGTAIGRQASVSGQYGYAIGYDANVAHNNSVALGTSVSTTAANQISLGSTSDTVRISETYTLPTSDGTANQVLTTDGSGAVTFADAGGGGAALYAANESSPAAQPSATGTNAIAIGDSAVSSGTNSVAIGKSASSNDGIAIGLNASTTALKGTAIGANSGGVGALSSGFGSMAFGASRSNGTESFAAVISNNTSSYGASGANSIAIGSQAKATGSDAVAIGDRNVASGNGSVALAARSTASGNDSVSIGLLSDATGNSSVALGSGYSFSGAQATFYNSIAIGQGSLSDKIGKVAVSGAAFSSSGDGQHGIFVLRVATTNATATPLITGPDYVGSYTADDENQIVLPNNSAYSFAGTIIARESAAAGSDYASWEIKGALLRDANAASTVLGNGIQNKLYATSGASAWAIALSADTTNGGLKIEVTGAASTNIRWVATVNTSEVTYA